MQKVIDVVEEEIGERLPDSQSGQYSGGNQAEPLDELIVAADSREVIDERFEDENAEVREQKHLHAGRDVKVEGDLIALDSRTGRHNSQVYGVRSLASKSGFSRLS